jgi:hypothetical protein
MPYNNKKDRAYLEHLPMKLGKFALISAFVWMLKMTAGKTAKGVFYE